MAASCSRLDPALILILVLVTAVPSTCFTINTWMAKFDESYTDVSLSCTSSLISTVEFIITGRSFN